MPKEIARLDTVWGWRAILGFICPSVYGSPPDRGIYDAAPEGVAIIAVSLGINVVSQENLAEARTHVDNAAKLLVEGGADFIHLAGPHGLFVSDKEIIKRIEELTKLPASTGINDYLEAMDVLSVKKIVHVHPGHVKGDYDGLFKKWYKNNGIEVVNFKGLEGPQTNYDVRRLPPGVEYQLARKAYLETPQADAVYIDCGAWGSPTLVDYLEQDIGKPVITVPALFLWAGLKALKIKAPVKGFGMLFDTLL